MVMSRRELKAKTLYRLLRVLLRVLLVVRNLQFRRDLLRTKTVPTPSDAEFAANPANLANENQSESKASDAFVMGQNAYKNGDKEGLKSIKYNAETAELRLKRAFANDTDRIQGVYNAVNKGTDIETYIEQRTNYLTPFQQEAIRKYAEAMDANKGAMDALEHADDGYADMLKQQLSQYTMENGNISSLTLTDGQRGYWKSKNEHGAGFGVFPDANGQPVVKQVPSSQVKENGKEIPLQEYVNQLATQKHEATKKNFNAIFDATSLKPNDTVSLSINDKDQPTEAKIVSVNPDGTISFNIAGSKNVTTVPVDTFTKFQKYALRNSINAELDAEDDEREQEAASQAEADKKQRYANGIVGMSEGQPDYSSKDTDPNVAAEYLQEQFKEDHVKLLNLVNGSRDDIKTQLANKRKAAIEYQNWLDTNSDLDPEKAKKVEDELSLVKEQIADLDARFKNWNTIRNSVMTPDEVKAMKEERKAEVEKAGVDESAIVPSDDFHVLVLEDEELKKQYPTMDKATDYITSQRKDLYHTQEDVERKINGVNDMLDQYINGETELDPSQLMELNTSKAQLEALQTNLSVAAKGLKAQANKLSRLYKTEVSKQEMEKLGMTPSEQRKALVADALKKNDMNAIHDIYKDASVDVMDLTPQTLEEAVSESLLPHSLNPESLQYELGKSNFKFGIGKGYDSNKFNYLIAKKGTGMSVNEFAVRVYNDLPVNLQDMGYTDQDVRNALLDMFKSYDSVKEMRNVALMNRIAAAEDELSSEEEYYEAQKEREIIERQAEIEQYNSFIHEKALSLPSESELDHIYGLEYDRMMEIEDREREYKQYVKSILPELADYDDRSNDKGYGGSSSLGSDSSRRGVDEGNSQGEEVGNGEASSESEIGEGSDSGRKGRQETGSLERGEGSAVRGSHLPQETSFGERLKSAIAETETEPTEAQKKAGNYKKGHLSFGGYDYTVETPKGVTRSGKDEQGKPWSVTMHDTYGYILGKIGVDGDHIDMFINDAADLDTFDGNVYVVDQVNPETGEFDEHKVMYGYPSEEAATEAYLANYSKGWKGLGKVTSVPKATFDKWLESSDRKTKPFAEYAMVQKEQAKFDRDVKEVKPSEMTEAQKVAYDAVSTMLKKAGIPVKVVSNEDMEKVAETQDNLAVEMLLNDPRLRFYIKTPEQKEAAKAAYDWAAGNRPDKFKQYAIVNMDNPNQPPQYFEKKDLAEKWRKYYTNAWKIGNYKAFNLNKPFEEQIKDVKGDVPSEFDPYKAESLLNKRIELEKQIKETEDSYNAKKKERAEYQNQLMQDYMDQHGLSSENDIPDDVWTDYRDKSFEKYQDTLDDLFHKYVELDNQLKAVAEPGVQYLKGKGVVYGYTDGKQIVLNQEHLNPNTPIHEYQHLWRTAAKNMNPELIEHGDKLIMQTQLFADLKQDPNYNHLTDEQICDEAFARLTGEDGAAILEQMAKDAIKENPLDTAKELSVINKLKEWLKKFWYWTLDTFTKWKPEDIKKMTLEDIRNLVLRDLANGVDPRTKLHEAENADDIKFMGSTTKKRMKDISTQLEGRELDEAQQAVADVYSGKKDNVSLTVEREDGSNKIIMRQGNDNHAGTKHSVFRHYGVKANSLNVDDLLLIPTVLKEGERKVSDNGRVAYVYVDPTSQVKYTVVTEPKNNKEFFNDFYSNKKANPSETSRVVENSTNTPEGAHNNDGNAFMDAKVDNNSETAKGNGENLSVEDKIKAVSQQFGVDEADVAMYANGVKKGSTAEAARARANIKRHLLQANEDKISSFKELLKYTVPVNEALKENFGDVDAMIEERKQQMEAQRNAMEAARKRAEEEEAKRQKHLEELSLIPDDQLDKQYMDALAKGDDATAREMLDEAARRKGYDDTESAYQGVGAWKAPGNPGYESDKARRDDWKSSGSDVNLEDMALGYTPQPDDYFSHPERYSQNTPHGLESVKAINRAIEAIKNGEKDVKVKVYRAVPTSVKEGKLRNGDWVTPSKKYADIHGNNRLEGKYRIIEDEVPATQLWWDGNDANEFGFDDGKEYKYKNAKNSRKLNDLVTYDDKGDVIPPSKRFNSRKSDVRFHRVTEVKSPIVEQKLQKHPDSLMKAGTYFSGGGLVEEGLKGIIDPVVAVEYDRKISGVYRNNFGQHIVTADVRDVDPKELVKHIDGEVEYFHASPVCKNYSQAKSNSGEVELDKETAKSTADFIDAVKPRVVTIENVKGYKDSEAMKIITQALDKNGYKWDVDVYNAADFGGYTSRERLIVRAVKDGELPEKPKKQPRKGGWLEAVEDILPTLTVKESGVAPWMDARLKADGIDWQKVEKPLYVMGSAYADGKIPHAYGDEILPTLRTKSGDVIIMPGGKVLRADGRVLARITGLGDDYKLPKTESLAHTIIGNGIPVQLTQGVIAPLLNKDDLSGRNVLARLGSSIFKNNWDADKQKQVSDRVVNTANKLGGAEATVYTSVDEVPDAYLSDVKNGATGWYAPTTHTVHVYLPNCADVNEAERTVLHEKIGHEGMEVLLGGENEVRKFANFVYRSASKDVRGKIIDFANKYDPDWKNNDRINVGTQEYIAHLAEEGPKTAEDFSLWTKIKHYLIKVLKKLGVRVPGLLNDKDLRYYLMKAGKALHVWDEMPQEKQEAMMKQASNAEIKDALSDGANLPSEEDNKPKNKTERGRIDEATGAFKLAPNGEQSNLSKKQYIEARTKNFKDWFGGDWEKKPKDFKNKLDANGEPLEKYVEGYLNRPKKPTMPKKRKGEDEATFFGRKMLYSQALEDWPKTEADWKKRIDEFDENTLAALTPPDEEAIREKYQKQYENDMASWRKDHPKIKEGEERPLKIPDMRDYQSIQDYGEAMGKYEIWKTAPHKDEYDRMAEDEIISKVALMDAVQHPFSEYARLKAMKAEFQHMRHVMQNQKVYDQNTTDAVVQFAKRFMSLGYGDDLGRGSINTLLTIVKNSTGKKSYEISQHFYQVMDVLMNNQLRNFDRAVMKTMSIKELKENAKGVQVQGKLELRGQTTIKAFRDAVSSRIPSNKLDEKISSLIDKMTDDRKNASSYQDELLGLNLAKQYVDYIDTSRTEAIEIEDMKKKEIEDYKNRIGIYEGELTKALLQEHVERLNQYDEALFNNKLERMERYSQLLANLGGMIDESVKGAREFQERDALRAINVKMMASADLGGKSMNQHHKENWKTRLSNSDVARFFCSPLGSFDALMREFGSKHINGEGQLWNHFVRGAMKASNDAFKSVREANNEIDLKVSELFGKVTEDKDGNKKGNMILNDLYELERSNEVKSLDVTIRDIEGEQTYKLQQGNLMYIYMVNKMPDGAMKLREMGILDADVERIKKNIDPRFLKLADWIQGEFLPKMRTKYNKRHEELFGAPMPMVENYFPLRVLKNARYMEEDVNNTSDGSNALPSTATGAIIKRKINKLPLDILNADALSVTIDNIKEMENWYNYAPIRKDANTLLSDTAFRNRVQNMTTIYGSGERLWNNVKDATAVAMGTYRPKGGTDLAVSLKNIGKGITGAKISGRLYTAFKQILSAPMFLPDVDLGRFVRHFIKPYSSFKWAIENMPNFDKRWSGRKLGDTVLMDGPTDWKLWHTNLMEKAAYYGMTPNALVDAVTCAVGARAVYDTKYKQYIKAGLTEERAKEKALSDAEINFNTSQQSSEGAFVSPMQLDRTLESAIFTPFRNSSMLYERKGINALRNLKHRIEKGHKEASIKFMAGQLMDEGVGYEQATKAAEKMYQKGLMHNIADAIVSLWLGAIIWNLGGNLGYLLFGDDNEKKKKMIFDAIILGLLEGPVDGLAGGQFINTAIANTITSDGISLKGLKNVDFSGMPMLSDFNSMIEKFGYDKVAGAQDLMFMVMQSGTGFNPKTLTDAINACIDYGNGDMTNAKEIALFVFRLMNGPAATVDNLYIDELGMKGKDAKKLSYEELAKRYAEYKFGKNTFGLDKLYSDEEKQKKLKAIEKSFDKKVSERLAGMDREDLKNEFSESRSQKEKKLIGKIIADELETKDSEAVKKAKADASYLRQRNFSDLMDDLYLQKEWEATNEANAGLEELKGNGASEKEIEAYKTKHKADLDKRKAIQKARKKMQKKKADISSDNDEATMAAIRKLRDSILKTVRQTKK
jgi:site-specific DNA-cytosine methylase